MKYFLKSLGTLLLASCTVVQAQVSVTHEGDFVTMTNKQISVSFNKTNADLTKIIFSGQSLLNGKDQRGYLLGPGFSMSPSRFSIVRQSPELVELSFVHNASNHFQYNLHYILKQGDAGVYCFLVQSHPAGDSAGDYGQTRWGIRSDESLFDYHLVRDSIQGPMPKMAELKDDVQDWTYHMPDGSYYTKYNYADYIDGHYVHGMAGQKSGLGMFVIQASHEYLNGGPTKQYQNVHSNPYLINMFNCGHFLSDKRNGDNIVSDGWKKIDGPFLLYFNKSNNIHAIWEDAKQKAAKEKGQWPYAWMQNEAYPLQRGSVEGTLLIDKQPADASTIILAQPGRDWQAQSQGYIFATHTLADGSFKLPAVRPGIYMLYAYGNNSTDEYQQAKIVVSANQPTRLGKIQWMPPKAGILLWQIGKADRKTTGFRYADHKRDYSVFNLPPSQLDYYIEKNKTDDWYYAQTKNGSWNIHFNLDKKYTGTAQLTIGIAGSAKNPPLEVWVNGTRAGSYRFGNDASIYRSAIAGGYYYKQEVPFAGSLLKTGENIISLKLPDVKNGGGIMYDVIKLEAE